MAATLSGDMLTEANRELVNRKSELLRAQVRVAAREKLLIDPTGWASEMAKLTEEFSNDFLQQTQQYHALHRTAEGATTKVKPIDVRDFSRRKAFSTLYGVGIAQVREQGLDISGRAVDKIADRVSSSLLRTALEVSRQYSMDHVKSDPEAVGYARVGEGSECDFCAMLVSRGAVYTQESVNFEAHPNCRCTSEMVYRNWQASPSAQQVTDVMAKRNDEEVFDQDEKEVGGEGLGEVKSISSAKSLLTNAAPPVTTRVDLGLTKASITDIDTSMMKTWIESKVVAKSGVLDTGHLASLRSNLETIALKELKGRNNSRSMTLSILRDRVA